MLLTGDYTPLLPAFQKMHIDQFVLEHSTPRAGDVEIVARGLADRELGLGVVNPRTAVAESPDEIVQRVDEVLAFLPPEKVFLNPDCGFGCFANRCVNDHETAKAKTRSMVEAANVLRDRY